MPKSGPSSVWTHDETGDMSPAAPGAIKKQAINGWEVDKEQQRSGHKKGLVRPLNILESFTSVPKQGIVWRRWTGRSADQLDLNRSRIRYFGREY